MMGLAMSPSAIRRGRAGALGSGPNGRLRLRAVKCGSPISGAISGGIGELRPTPSFLGRDSVPLVNQATMLEFGGGLTGRLNANVSVFANVDYEFAVGSGDDKRNGVRGAFGARYTW